MNFTKALLASSALLASATIASADEGQWWPFSIDSAKGGDLTQIEKIDYVPLEKAEKEWNLCVLFPHLQDAYWLGSNYGIAAETERLGVKFNLYQAGGYSNLPKQVSQFDDCIASGADAILVAPISEAGVAAKINEAMGKGIPVFALSNPILDTPITGRITPDFHAKGFVTGEYVKQHLGDKTASAVGFPGPQGSGWAETYMSGFRDSTATGNVKLLAELYGEASVPAQLRLVEDALQTYPDMTVIWGGAPTAEAAVGATKDAGVDALIVASYENPTVLEGIRKGDILALATEYPVMMARITVDMAVRALEGKEHEKILLVTPGLVTADTIGNFDLTQIFAPEGFQPVFASK